MDPRSRNARSRKAIVKNWNLWLFKYEPCYSAELGESCKVSIKRFEFFSHEKFIAISNIIQNEWGNLDNKNNKIISFLVGGPVPEKRPSVHQNILSAFVLSSIFLTFDLCPSISFSLFGAFGHAQVILLC